MWRPTTCPEEACSGPSDRVCRRSSPSSQRPSNPGSRVLEIGDQSAVRGRLANGDGDGASRSRMNSRTRRPPGGAVGQTAEHRIDRYWCVMTRPFKGPPTLYRRTSLELHDSLSIRRLHRAGSWLAVTAGGTSSPTTGHVRDVLAAVALGPQVERALPMPPPPTRRPGSKTICCQPRPGRLATQHPTDAGGLASVVGRSPRQG
jgi:hypothetical protein